MIGSDITSPSTHRLGSRLGVAALLIACAAGCAATGDSQAPKQTPMAALSAKIQALEYQLLATQLAISTLNGEQLATRETLARQITDLDGKVENIPATMTSICSLATTSVTTQCDQNAPTQTVVMSGDKMVVGEMERVWIDPPGVSLTARVDTGAHSSSLHAENLVEFERDGDDWVRFDVVADDSNTTLERPVTRYVRVFQQADPVGTRRPVVAVRLRLGDVQDSFEFTLADRSHLNFQMLLGRNFLTDMALVDVGRQFVQPQFKANQD